MARQYQFRWAFANTKHSAYGTAIVDGSLLKAAFIKGPDLAVITPRLIRDNSQSGRGDEWSHGQEVEAWDVSLKRNLDMTSLLAGLFCGFGLGAVTTSQPDAGGNPTVYDHDFTPMVASTSVQLPAITLVEEPVANTGIKKKIHDLVVAMFEISGSGVDRLQISADLKGSGNQANSTLSMPALTATKFLRMKDVKFELGNQGGALTDMSSRLKRFHFKYNNKTLDEDGYTPGSGLYRGRHEIGDRGDDDGIELDFDLLQATDGAELDRLINNTNSAIKITAEGETITGIYKHRLIIDLPDLHFRTVERKYVDGKLAYGVSCNIHYDDTGGVLYPVKISVRNTETAYL